MKLIHQTTDFCRPSPRLQSFTIRIPGADAPGYYATAPMRGLRIRLAALAGWRRQKSFNSAICYTCSCSPSNPHTPTFSRLPTPSSAKKIPTPPSNYPLLSRGMYGVTL